MLAICNITNASGYEDGVDDALQDGSSPVTIGAVLTEIRRHWLEDQNRFLIGWVPRGHPSRHGMYPPSSQSGFGVGDEKRDVIGNRLFDGDLATSMWGAKSIG